MIIPADVVPPALRCAASRRRTRLAENHGKPSLGVFIIAPGYNVKLNHQSVDGFLLRHLELPRMARERPVADNPEPV